jgi:hypothetical protein
MKLNRALVIASLIMTLIAQGQATLKEKIIGKWTSPGSDMAYIIFKADGHVVMEAVGDEVGGADFTFGGKPSEMRFEIDDSAKPNTLDIVTIELNTKQELNRIPCLIELTEKSQLKIAIQLIVAMGSLPQRPTSFEHAIVFTKAR